MNESRDLDSYKIGFLERVLIRWDNGSGKQNPTAFF